VVLFLWVAESIAIQWDSSDGLKRTSDGERSRLIHAHTSQLSLSSCTEEDEVVPDGYFGNNPWFVFLDTSNGPDQWHNDFTFVGVGEGGTETRSFRLSSPPTSKVTVTISDESDTPAQLNFSITTLTFTPINWCQTQQVTFTIVNNNTVDDYTSKTAKAIFKPTGGGIYQGIIGGQYFLHWNNIKDDEQHKAGLTVEPTRLNMKEEETKSFTVKLAWQPSSTVTVTVPDVPRFYLSHNKDTLKFSSVNWNTEREVKVTVDRDPDRDWITRNASYNLIAKGSGYDGKVKKIEVAITNSDVPIIVKITDLPKKINSTDKLTAGFKFSQDVTEFDTTDVKVRNGIRGTFAGSGSNYTLDITPKGNKNVVVTVIANAATNGSNRGPTKKETIIVEWDDTAPSVEIMGLPAKINSTDPLTATFTFTEAVMGFETGDITVTGGSPGTLSGSGENYSLVITPAGSDDVVVTVKKNAASDGLNIGPASLEEETVVWDDDVPNVQIGGLPFKINSRDSLTATFIFTEAVVDIDVTVRGGKDGAISGLTPIYPFQTMEIIPDGNADVVVTVAKDAMTDGLNTGPPNDVTKKAEWDDTRPDVTITGLPEKINSTSQLTATFEFTEDVRFRASGVRITGGKKGEFERSDNGAFPGSGKRYTLETIPDGDTNLEVEIRPNKASDGLNLGPTSSVSKTVVWDATTPTVTISGLSDRHNTTTDQTATFTFSEDVTDFVKGDIGVTGGSAGTFATTSATVYTLVITPTSGEDLVVTVGAGAATDGANTGPATAQSHTSTWDATAPTVTISGLSTKHKTTANQTATFTFDKDVTGFVTGDVSVTGGTKKTFTGTSGGTVYTLVITPTSEQNLMVTVNANAANDDLNNAGPATAKAHTSTWDAEAPTVEIKGLPEKINSKDPLTATFTFSEDVTGFDTGDVKIEGGMKGAFAPTSKTVYRLVITPTGNTNLVVTVNANAATDGLNTGPSTAETKTVIWDSNVPNVTISGLPAKINTTNPLTARFEFNEAVTGFEAGDIKVSGATPGTFTANTATTYSLQILPSGSGNVVVTVEANAASDGINTGPADLVSFTSVWDGDTPGVTLTGVPEKINSRASFTVTFTFSEDVTGFIKDDVGVTNAAKGIWSVKNATIYTLLVTPSSDQDVAVIVPANVATDGTNTGPATPATATAIWDATPPTVAIGGLPERIATTDPQTVTFTFSEEVIGFVSSDIEVTAASKGTFTGSKKSYTLRLTPTGSSDVIVKVIANAATDGINTGPISPTTATAIWDSERIVTLTVDEDEVQEGGSVRVSVNLSGFPFSSAKTIPLVYPRPLTGDDTATEPADYTKLPSITIPDGASTGTGTINTRDDDVYEGDEKFKIALGALPTDMTRGDPDSQTITIKENDTPPPVEITLIVDKNTVQEGDRVKVTAKIAGALSYPVDVPLVYRPGGPVPAQPSDYTPVTNLEIAAETKTAEDFITINNDAFPEEDEVFVVSLGSLNSSNLIPGNPSFQPITIQDQTLVPTVTLSAARDEVTEGEKFIVTVTVSKPLISAVTIPIALTPLTAIPSEDYQIPSPLAVRIPAGGTNENVVISTIEDERLEEDETFRVALGNLPPTVEGSDEIVLTIKDDEIAQILTNPASSIAVVEGGFNVVQVRLSATPSDPVIVTITGYNAPLRMPSPPSLTFTDLNWDDPQEVTLTADNDQNSVNETIDLTLTANGGGYIAVTAHLRVVITDTNVAQLVAQNSLEVPEGGDAMLDVSLTSAPISLATVTLSGTPISALTYDPPRLIFSTANWNQSKKVTFRAAEDNNFINEPAEFTITAVGYTDKEVTSRLQVTIIDNDQPDLKDIPASLSIQEGETTHFEVSLNGQPSSIVNVTVDGYSEYLEPPKTLSFTPAKWNQRQSVILTAVEDDEDFDNETFTLTLTANGGEFKQVTKTIDVTIVDNDERLEPVYLIIYDQRVTEDRKQTQIDLELSRPTTDIVSVQYESSDGTAEAGSDYVASRGIVIFDPLAIRGVIQFEIEDDGVVEPEETFVVTLSNPINALIGQETATVTILDPAPASILRIEDATVTEDAQSVRFHIHISPPSMETITIRYQTEDGTAKAGEDYEAMAGVLKFLPAMKTMTLEVPLMGEEVNWHTETFTVHLSTSEPVLIEKPVATATITDDIEPPNPKHEALLAYTARFLRTSASEIMEGVGQRLKNQPSVCSAASRSETARLWHSASFWDPSLAELLSGCHLTSERGGIHLWGRGGYRRFTSQKEEEVTVKGDVSTAMVGVDYRWRSGWLTGVLISHGQGNGSFEGLNAGDEIHGSMTGLFPYLAYHKEAWEIWGTAGLWSGRTEVVDLKRSWSAGFGAVGLQGVMTTVKVVDLRYYGDALMTATKVDDQGVGVVRIRAGMEARAQLSSMLYPYLEAGVRQDAGSAEEGVGVELGAGMRVQVPALRLNGDVRTQRLIVHTADGFTEWGLSGSLEFGNHKKGLQLLVHPSWGPNHGQSLYHQQTILDATPTRSDVYRTEMELRYGIPIDETIIRTIVGVTTFERGILYRLGGELRSWGQFSVSAFGIVHNTDSHHIGMNVQGLLQY